MEKTGHWEEMVIATKYTLSPMAGQHVQQRNYGGNGTKSMHVSIHASMENLRNDYVEIVS